MSKEGESQEKEEYKPTTAERKLLDVMLNPDHRYLSICKIAELAGCDRAAYYRAFKKPEFADYYRRESRALVSRALAPVINACINEAIRGSAPHSKIILAMAGEYSEKSEVVFPDKNGDPQDVGGVVFYMPSNGRDPEPGEGGEC